MARINRVEHARKVYKCSKCSRVISKGSPYLKATPFHRPTIIRCIFCGIQDWETSTSDFVQRVGNIACNWEELYGCEPESIVEDLREIYDECESSFDTIPENLQNGPVAETIQERMDMLDSVITELENIDDIESFKEEIYDSQLEVYRSDKGLDEETPLTEEQESELEDLVLEQAEEDLRSAIEEAIGCLEY